MKFGNLEQGRGLGDYAEIGKRSQPAPLPQRGIYSVNFDERLTTFYSCEDA